MSNGLDLDVDDWHDVVSGVRQLRVLMDEDCVYSACILLGELFAHVNAMDSKLRESEELRQAEVDRANGAVIDDVLATIGSEGSE